MADAPQAVLTFSTLHAGPRTAGWEAVRPAWMRGARPVYSAFASSL